MAPPPNGVVVEADCSRGILWLADCEKAPLLVSVAVGFLGILCVRGLEEPTRRDFARRLLGGFRGSVYAEGPERPSN